jgi:penicillin-binding protein 1B
VSASPAGPPPGGSGWRKSLRRRPGRWASLVVAGLAVVLALAAFARFAAQVDALRSRRATGPSWSFPSRVYSAGVALVPGRPLPRGYLRDQLRARGYRAAGRPLREPGTFALVPGGVEIFLRGFQEAPDPAGSGGPERVRLHLDRGLLLDVERMGAPPGARPPDLARPARLEPALVAVLLDRHRVHRTWVPLARVPKVVRDAVIASEDRRFHRHLGLDLRSNLRALLANLRAGSVREGGSTITQQLARGLFLGPERTLGRKLAEMWLAVLLELALSKDEILEMYLNMVYWGRAEGRSVAGIGEAARWYFGRPVESLGLNEAALLAGLIPAPNAASPFRNPAAARRRRNAVLRDLVANHLLDPAAAARALRAPLGARRGAPPPERFPSFTDYVREALRPLPEGAAEHWGLDVFTSLDPVWQEQAERALADGITALERWRGRGHPPLEGAFVAIDPATGYVPALVGGRRPRPGDFNRATQARRQPGSAIKPLVYAAALDRSRGGSRFNPATTVPDLRRTFATPEGPWNPRNDEGEYHPRVTLAKALAKSLNVATANLVERVGSDEVARYAGRFGLGELRPVPSIGLGTTEVSLIELTSAYGSFPNRGLRLPPTPVRVVLDGRGRVLLEHRPRPFRVLPVQTAALMTGLLEDVVIFGVSHPLRSRFGFTRPIGGKTGTTNDYLDAWFVGFTPDLAAGVWVGFDQPRSLARPAAETALPVWAGIVERLIAEFPPREFPDSRRLDLVWIDPWSGGLARMDCPRPMRVPFLRGTAPRRACEEDHAAEWAAVLERHLGDRLEAEWEEGDSSVTPTGSPTTP